MIENCHLVIQVAFVGHVDVVDDQVEAVYEKTKQELHSWTILKEHHDQHDDHLWAIVNCVEENANVETESIKLIVGNQAVVIWLWAFYFVGDDDCNREDSQNNYDDKWARQRYLRT